MRRAANRSELSSVRVFAWGLIAGVAAAAPAAWGQCEPTETHKLVASDPQASAGFGLSVAVSGNLAIVGAPTANGGAVQSGIAYVYDVKTGVQLHRLTPSDAQAGDQFGWAVAISGDVAIIGARRDDDLGSNSGSAYVFNAATGQQLFKLRASDGAAQDEFGYSVAIAGDRAIVGARLANNFGANDGKAYIFDVTTGQQKHRLMSADNYGSDEFGTSVAISGNIAIVGAPFHDAPNFVRDVGAVYVYDVESGNLLHKLSLPEIVQNTVFGRRVALDGTTAAISASSVAPAFASVYNAESGAFVGFLQQPGSYFSTSLDVSGSTAVVGWDGAGPFLGAAFVYNTETGALMHTLVGSGLETTDYFGTAVAISGGTTIVGAYLDDHGGFTDAGSAYLFGVCADTDGDGLPDDWEINGIPYESGGQTHRFMLPGADPLRKNLYLEIDAMEGFELGDWPVAHLVAAFANAPVSNPDGSAGITLSILRDDTDLPHVADWPTNGCWPVAFGAYRQQHFGTFWERGDPHAEELLKAKAKAYRYCIIADRASPTRYGGCGHMPGDNFVVYFGSVPFEPWSEAAVIMHELGHNLGLHHGGGDAINGKPNYPSVMNYALSYPLQWNDAFWRLDYCRAGPEHFALLDESFLDETLGVGKPDGFYRDYWMPFGVNVLDGGVTVRTAKYVRLNGSPTDFGDQQGTGYQDGMFDLGVEQDLNYAVDPPLDVMLPSQPSPGDFLEAHNDWANIRLATSAAIGPGAPAPEIPEGELTEEALAWINENFPLPPVACYADFNGDTQVNSLDFLAFLNAYVSGDPASDCSGDTVVNSLDVLCFLNLYVAGCE
ncbi:MAG TPA: GC-type dockerin domain-anchored protein [Phycisphaerales bacterium]|nr:GC-type dockerin domain-anchored protein [Phycisphaerales bacterium]